MIGPQTGVLIQLQEQSLTRRSVLRRLSAAGLGGALVATGAVRVGAQETATPVTMSGDVPPVIQAWVDAQNNRDAAAHAALYTADGVLEDVPNQSSARGAEILPFITGVLNGFGDLKVELQHAFQAGDWAAAEYVFTATNAGLIPVPAAIGKSFSTRTTTIFELEGDKIRRSSDYYDAATILRQLGLMPDMAGPPPGASPAVGTPAS